VSEIIVAFWRHGERHYRTSEGKPSLELDNFREALKPVRSLYGSTPARDFGPLALRSVREAMVKARLARTTINSRVNRIRRVFKWAASVELVPASVVEALRTVTGLSAGRTEAVEAEPVGPIPIKHVDAVLPFLPRAVAAMVQIQLLTGCRVTEIVTMRGCDLTPGDPTWEYRPGSHKNRWRGKGRVIPLGHKAQAIVKVFLKPDLSTFLFDPRASVQEHHAKRAASRKTKRTPSERSRRCKTPGEGRAPRYDRRTYRQSVVRACRKAGVPEWSPGQLRHNTATAVRSTYGLEAASVMLGHAKPDTTLIYAERDLSKARAIAAEIG
jgi:integrase